MNRFRAWGLVAALAVGTSAPASAADPPTDPNATTDTRPWYKKMFFSAPKPAGPTVRTGAVAAVPGRPPVAALLPPEAVAEAMKAEYAAWDRRMKVCDALREIALERRDDALLRQAEELDRQANAIYQQRVSALGVPKVRAPLPAPEPAGLSAFKVAPEKPEDPAAAAARLVAPAAPVPVTGTASTAPLLPSAQPVREVKQ
ncbi:hypothetical protein [Frigoriglobus tundricola]|uniref:Uncharacterized protein n=1 Tax=Frigoriglobus tundricola TaxID=2774151 RepID=A0A6M5YXG3_9BACT|nr:hypothetical protein [Frigoriglobus tundricola]QJW97971.1 hypothetical protein FTUN_5551 [Frigoriglobus tundricola]